MICRGHSSGPPRPPPRKRSSPPPAPRPRPARRAPRPSTRWRPRTGGSRAKNSWCRPADPRTRCVRSPGGLREAHLAPFLSDDGVVREGGRQPRDDQRLGPPVELRDQVDVLGLEFDRGTGPPPFQQHPSCVTAPPIPRSAAPPPGRRRRGRRRFDAHSSLRIQVAFFERAS